MPLGKGIFKIPAEDGADLGEVELESEEYEESSDSEQAGLAGTLYAYSFPLLVSTTSRFPIKVGMASGDAERRVLEQCRHVAIFEQPRVLKTWEAQRIRFLEKAVHSTLRARGKWREEAPGTEWFNTTVDEIDAIVRFVELG